MRQEPKIGIIGTFDTKAEEFGYLAEQIRAMGARTVTIDAGFHARSAFAADHPCKELVELAGAQMDKVRALPRNEGMAVAIRGAQALLAHLLARREIDGLIGMGGSGGTTIAASVMQTLPLGFPKLIVSTLGSSSKISNYVAGRDIMILHSVVDVSGLNSVTTRIFNEAAGAIVGAARNTAGRAQAAPKPRIAATMYGLTTPGVTAAKAYLESLGYEVITFHAVGSGGRAMEALIREGFFVGVLDMTLPEVLARVMHIRSSDPGEGRLCGAAQMGIAQVVCPGAMDMVSTTDFSQYPDHQVYCHNTTPSHLRPNAQDVRLAGRYMAECLNQSKGPCAVFFPKKGLSMVDLPGKPLYDPLTDAALLETLRAQLDKNVVELHELDMDINDERFATQAARWLHEMILTTRGR